MYRLFYGWHGLSRPLSAGQFADGSMINSLHRVNIAGTVPVMTESLGWDEGRFGGIFSAFLVVPESIRTVESDPSSHTASVT